MKRFIGLDSISLQEAKFSEGKDGTKLLEVTIVREGWSKNGNYWTKESLPSVVDSLLRRPKLFADHEEDAEKRRTGRRVREWAANAVSAKVIEGEEGQPDRVDAVIEMTDNPGTLWIYKEAQKDASRVQLSVDGSCRVKNDVVREGKTGREVLEMKRMASTDFVTYASAGGEVRRVAASEREGEFLFIEDVEEAMDTLQKKLADSEKNEKMRRAYWDLQSAFRSLLGDIATADDDDITDADRKKAIDQGIDDFAKRMKSFPVKIFEAAGIEMPDPGEEPVIEKDKGEAQPLKEEVENMGDLSKLTEAELLASRPDLAKAISESAIAVYEEKGDLARTVQEKVTLEGRVSELETENKDLKKFEDENKGLKEQVAKTEAKEVLTARREFIAAKVKELEIPESILVPSVVKVLEGYEKDVEVEEFLKEIKPAAGKVSGMGPTPTKQVKEGETQEPTMSDEEAAEGFTG